MPKKIFELANELGKKPLDLVEELKSHGFAVKSHMSVLSDDDIAKYDGLVAAKAKEEAPAKKKVVRKKAAKKKTAKKTSVVKKTASASDDDSEGEEPKKKTVTRKKTVVRRKVSKAAEVVEEPVVEEPVVEEVSQQVETEEQVVAASEPVVEEITAPVEEVAAEEVKAAAEDTKQEPAKEEAPKKREGFGLRIVSKPDAAEKKAREAKREAEKQRPAQKDINSKVPPTTVDDKKDSKNRLSGLASMLNAKKNVNRAQTLNEERASTEMKSYASLQGTGRPMYTQVKRRRAYTGPSKSTLITEVKDSKRVIKLHNGAYAEQLAKKLSVKLKDMIDTALQLNLLIKNGDYIGMNLATQIAALYSYRVEDASFDEDAVLGKEDITEEAKSKLPLRAPVVTIMGHVDHGKTTLLDFIRNETIAAGEAGGITQHIGAYSVDVKGSKLTFLDTPGHAAFGAMRQRGADITDIVVLIVAADDGVMPQTVESIKYIQNSGKPVIVAVNKMDREGANPDRIKQGLTEHNITPEEWGGDTQFCNISALKGDGVDELLESIALQAEILELRADPKGTTEGVVIESRIEHGRGPVATVLMQEGTIKKGDAIVVGETYGRARSLTDHKGVKHPSAGPSTPVQIIGLDEAPSPGDTLNVVKNEREAKKIVDNRKAEKLRIKNATKVTPKVSLEDFFATAATEEGQKKELNLVIRSDVQGSFEAIKTAIETISNSEVEVKVIRGGVGQISDSDVELANTSSAFVIGFNMRPSTSARKLSEKYGVDIKTYSIIYELINDVKLAVEGLLDPEFTEEYIGRAEVRDTFSVPKIGTIAGSVVVDGSIQSGCNVRLLREGKIIFDGKMSSLKRFKDDVKEVKNGFECGVGLENYDDIKVGDLFEAYNLKEKKRTLEDVMSSEAVL